MEERPKFTPLQPETSPYANKKVDPKIPKITVPILPQDLESLDLDDELIIVDDSETD